jgi:hypothetical protein
VCPRSLVLASRSPRLSPCLAQLTRKPHLHFCRLQLRRKPHPICGEGLLEASNLRRESISRWVLSLDLLVVPLPVFLISRSVGKRVPFFVACVRRQRSWAVSAQGSGRNRQENNWRILHGCGVPGFLVDFRGVSGFAIASCWLSWWMMRGFVH